MPAKSLILQGSLKRDTNARRAERETILDTGYWILDTGYWILDTGYWILDTGYWILDKALCAFFLLHDLIFAFVFHVCCWVSYLYPT